MENRRDWRIWVQDFSGLYDEAVESAKQDEKNKAKDGKAQIMVACSVGNSSADSPQLLPTVDLIKANR